MDDKGNTKGSFVERNPELLESDDEVESMDKRQFNKFRLLDLVESDENESSLKADSSDETSSEKDCTNSDKNKSNLTGKYNKSNPIKSKPRKRRGKSIASKKSSHSESNEIDNIADLIVQSKDLDANKKVDSKYKLLKVDMRNLVPEAELKRIFGRSVIKDDKSKPKIYPGSNFQRSRFVTSGYFEIKPSVPFTGPKMEIDDTINQARNNSTEEGNESIKIEPTSFIFSHPDRPIYFKFVHDKVYQEAQRMFIEAVNRGHSDFIVQNLSIAPFHVESMIQLSHMIRVSEDYKTAAEFIERALIIFERGFHPKFNLATASCRLSYKRPENRTFFITIFKHIDCCHRRGLRRTPFEYSKLLLSLEPDNDPLMAVQLLDFYALRSEEYAYLIEFYSRWHQLQKLPNLSLSVAMAYFLKSRCTRQSKVEKEANLKLADEQLKNALMIFPNFIIPLLDTCSGEPDAALKKCSYFDYGAASNKYKFVPETVDVLVNLYVKRTFSLWKQKAVLAWLERNVAELVELFSSGEIKDEGKHIEHWSNFTKIAPKNLLRHIVLCDLDIKVPPSASSSSYIDIDPYPPTDSIITNDLSITSRGSSLSTNNAVSGSLFEQVSGLFLRSILPSFSLDGQNQPSQNFSSANTSSSQTSSSESGGRQQTTSVETSRIPEGGAVIRISGADREESHYLNREGAESLMTIIESLQDLQGVSIEEISIEEDVTSQENQENSSEQRSEQTDRDDENELRRRHRSSR